MLSSFGEHKLNRAVFPIRAILPAMLKRGVKTREDVPNLFYEDHSLLWQMLRVLHRQAKVVTTRSGQWAITRTNRPQSPDLPYALA